MDEYPHVVFTPNPSLHLEQSIQLRSGGSGIETHSQPRKSADCDHVLEWYRKWWGEIEERWQRLLTIWLGSVVLPLPQFTAHLTTAVIFPRDLWTGDFLVPERAERQTILRVCAHEVAHYHYYYCLASLLPDKKKELFSSRPVWSASEALIPLLFELGESKELLGEQAFGCYAWPQLLLEKTRPLFEIFLRKEIDIVGLTLGLIDLSPPNPTKESNHV